ncbi:MAG: tetratricopeptide repeat protein [Terrimicrobiaceae bacterium]
MTRHFPVICLISAIAALPALGAGSAPIAPPDEPTVKETPAPKEKPVAKEKPSAKEKPAAKQESSAVAVYNEGVALMQAKRFAQAQKKFEQAVRLDPNFAEAYNNLAFTLRKQGSGNYKQSLAYYNKAIDLKPKLAEAYMYRGVLYTQMGRKADAQADLASLKKLDPQLAKELEEYFETGKEEDYLYGAAKKK